MFNGFLAELSPQENLLYFFLVLVADRDGLSFYSYDKICQLLKFELYEYIKARNGLMDKDLIAFDGTVFQVLELPANPVSSSADQKYGSDQAAIAQLADRSLKRMAP